jgi:hypothetical protein
MANLESCGRTLQRGRPLDCPDAAVTRHSSVAPGTFAPPDNAHAVVAYRDGEQWYLVDSISSSDEFHDWITRQPRRFDANFSNPFYTSYSFFNWSRLTGQRLAFDQKRPFPTALVIFTENPPLLAAATKAVAIAALFGVILLWSRRRRVSGGIAATSARLGLDSASRHASLEKY